MGLYLSADGATSIETSTKLAKTRIVFVKLHLFCKHEDISFRWKLKVYQATFMPMVTYTTESAALAAHDYQQLAAFHHFPLLEITNTKTTHVIEVIDPQQEMIVNATVRARAPPPIHAAN